VRISELTLRVAHTELAGLDGFDRLVVVSRPLVPGRAVPSLMLVATGTNRPDHERVLAWPSTVEDAVAILEAVQSALCGGVPVVDLRKRVRVPDPEELAGLEALPAPETPPAPEAPQQEDSSRVKMTPSELAEWMKAATPGPPGAAPEHAPEPPVNE
jgi:hypothetical protein